MNWPRLCMMAAGITASAVQAPPASASADGLTRLGCISADMALDRGHAAMEGKTFVGSDGKPYVLGPATTTTNYGLTAQEEASARDMADAWTPGAIEYVDRFLVGPGSLGRVPERHMSDLAQKFIAFYTACLNRFGVDFRE